MPDPPVRISFLGAAGTVTGSRHLLEVGETAVLLDCGMFQGLKEHRLLNWKPFPYEPSRLAAVVLSHAHLDHSGWLPRLVAEGFRGPIFATAPTRELLSILWADAAALQEEEADFANRQRYSRHDPALPLFTRQDAERALGRVVTVRTGELTEAASGFSFLFRRAGHILGASLVEAWLGDGPGAVKLAYSGDLGRYDVPIMQDPDAIADADHVVVESTYGDREHSGADRRDVLAREVREGIARGGMILVPAFAVGRTQELLYLLRELEGAGRIPRVRVWLDSPMGRKATEVYGDHRAEHDDETRRASRRGDPFETDRFEVLETRDESRRLNDLDGPGIVIAGSGMATGGRILHHLARRLPDPRTTVLFVGHQAAGTRGRLLVEGAPEVRIHGRTVPVRAVVRKVGGFSAHADCKEVVRWLRGFQRPPRTAWLVHGEPEASRALRVRIEGELGWDVKVPSLGETAVLLPREAEVAAR